MPSLSLLLERQSICNSLLQFGTVKYNDINGNKNDKGNDISCMYEPTINKVFTTTTNNNKEDQDCHG